MKFLPLIAIVQMLIHYLAIIGIILGVIAFLFGNFSRGFELIIGGIILMGIKYLIGMIFVFLIKMFDKQKNSSQIPKQ